ncbi:MAG: hypothetical protein IJ735_01990 [Clostridia bacterium]|nr:hypothetical protein [Clostridia bacterium]
MTKPPINNAKASLRAINFDLDTNQMMFALGSKTAGYDKLKKSFKKVGFIHRQGSGYVSKKPLTNAQLMKAVKNVSKENAWLATCLNVIDVTKVEKVYDLTATVKAEAKKQAAQDKRKQKANAQAAVSKGSGKPAPKASTVPKSAPQTKKSPAKQMTTQKMIGKGFSL